MKNVTDRIQELRVCMNNNNIQACIIPTNDPHASEYVAEHWKARQYFSGFTGSAGTLVVTNTDAGLWTDSRYFLQAETELQNSSITLFKMGEPNTPLIETWLNSILKRKTCISINSTLFSIEALQHYIDYFTPLGIQVETELDLIDCAWTNRPPLPTFPIFIHNEKFAGLSVAKKLHSLRQQMDENDIDVLFLNALDEIAWIFNIRGRDIEYNPVTIAYTSIEKDKAILFIDPQKITAEIQTHLQTYNISTQNYNLTNKYLRTLKGKNIWIDKNKMNYAVYKQIQEQNNVQFNTSPILYSKSAKNQAEIEGTRLAMIKDGVALTRFWMWLEKNLKGKNQLTELSVADNLRSFRATQDMFFGESFAPIVGYKDHGAIVHYSANKNTNVEITPSGFLLIDSGAQFLHGTTDITRTFALGIPSVKEKRDFTLVLKGHIALAQAIFPANTCGYQLDVLAKQFLWAEGLTFGHGTGHGVGCFLCVHEGPQSIRPDANKTELKEGMIISNEPGLYCTGEYGIRLENLILVQKSNFLDKKNFFSFETLTLFPFDKKAIDTSLMTDKEIAWLNAYHQNVFDKLSPHLNETERNWLEEKCQPILN